MYGHWLYGHWHRRNQRRLGRRHGGWCCHNARPGSGIEIIHELLHLGPHAQPPSLKHIRRCHTKTSVEHRIGIVIDREIAAAERHS